MALCLLDFKAFQAGSITALKSNNLKPSNPNYVLPAPAPDTATRPSGQHCTKVHNGIWFLEVLA